MVNNNNKKENNLLSFIILGRIAWLKRAMGLMTIVECNLVLQLLLDQIQVDNNNKIRITTTIKLRLGIKININNNNRIKDFTLVNLFVRQ